MKRLNSILLLVSALNLTVSPSVVAQAFPMKVNIALTAVVQGADSASTATVRVSNRDLLAMVAKSLGLTFPKGAALVMQSSTFSAVTSDGSYSTNLSAFFDLGSSTNLVRRGGGSARAAFVRLTLSFDDKNGTSIRLNGVAKKTFSEHFGNLHSQYYGISMTVEGDGELQGRSAVISGAVSGSVSWRGTVTVPGGVIGFDDGEAWFKG